jgi:adenosylcobinamide kinase/adenosylcobinamide-phosphate guanylyltransferase
MKKRFILVSGGAKSGKSNFAVKLAQELGEEVVFLATCNPQDEEMRRKVALHQKSRPSHWKTIEKERNVTRVLSSLENSCQVVIIDCLTILISNLVLAGKKDEEIKDEIKKMAKAAFSTGYNVIIVTNEVGGGIVPENELGRRFRDLCGIANQIVAGYAKEVYLLVSGIPLKIK